MLINNHISENKCVSHTTENLSQIRYVRYVKIVSVVLFTKTWNIV